MKCRSLNGPTLNLRGLREPEIYGDRNYAALVSYVEGVCQREGIECRVFQSNHEGDIIDAIHAAMNEFDGIIINPGAYTHYSYAIRDAIEAVGLPTVEVHLSDIHAREPFRAVSVIEPVCIAQICGMGKQGYIEAAKLLLSRAMN